RNLPPGRNCRTGTGRKLRRKRQGGGSDPRCLDDAHRRPDSRLRRQHPRTAFSHVDSPAGRNKEWHDGRRDAADPQEIEVAECPAEGGMKIAVFCPNWVGDMVMATPALRAIRRQFSRAEIVAVVRPYVAEVLDGLDLVDRRMLHDPWKKAPGAQTTV